MKHVVIVAHPSPDSFNLSVANTYCQTVQELGHSTVMRDLYRMEFDPVLKDGESPSRSTPTSTRSSG